MLAGGLFSAFYATTGGMLADAVTDLVQFVLMCLSVGLIAGFALMEVGALADFAAALAPEMTSVRGSLSAGDIVVYLAVALTPLVDPSFLPWRGEGASRFARVSCWAGIVSAVLLFVLFETLGVYDPAYATRRLELNGFSLIREQLVFLSIPLVLVAGGLAVLRGPTKGEAA